MSKNQSVFRCDYTGKCFAYTYDPGKNTTRILVGFCEERYSVVKIIEHLQATVNGHTFKGNDLASLRLANKKLREVI